jgi:hypothetical protein
MTTINLAVQPKRRAAYLISDCAWTCPDGRVQKIAGKIISFERFPCAIGATGNVDLMAVAEGCLALNARNPRTLTKGLPAILRQAIEVTKRRFPDTAEVIGTLKVAAWNARKAAPEGYIVSSDDLVAENCIGAGWKAFEVAEVRSSVGTDVHPAELLGRECELHDPLTFDPHQDAFALVAEQRRRGQYNITPGIDGSVRFRIGGEVELTEVTRRGVKVWSCGTFPDQPGEFIQPEAPLGDTIGQRIAA